MPASNLKCWEAWAVFLLCFFLVFFCFLEFIFFSAGLMLMLSSLRSPLLPHSKFRLTKTCSIWSRRQSLISCQLLWEVSDFGSEAALEVFDVEMDVTAFFQICLDNIFVRNKVQEDKNLRCLPVTNLVAAVLSWCSNGMPEVVVGLVFWIYRVCYFGNTFEVSAL